MKTFSVHMSHESDMAISGDGLIQAVENNFQSIARAYHVGNVAGYALERVRMEWRDGILGGKGGVELRITARGSDMLAEYDPTDDAPKDTVVWIHASREDLPEPHEFEINRRLLPRQHRLMP